MNPLVQSALTPFRRVAVAVLWTPRRALIALVVAIMVVSVGITLVREANARWQYQRALAQYEEDLAAYTAATAEEKAAREAERAAEDAAGRGVSERTSRDPATGDPVRVPGPDGAGQAGTDDLLSPPRSGAEAVESPGVDVAADFAAVFWGAPSYPSHDEWVADLTPLVAPALVGYLEQTPLEAVTGGPEGDPVTEVGGFSATVEWNVAEGVFRVVTTDTGDGWVVVDYEVTP